jgi:hypothetical protein
MHLVTQLVIFYHVVVEVLLVLRRHQPLVQTAGAEVDIPYPLLSVILPLSLAALVVLVQLQRKQRLALMPLPD